MAINEILNLKRLNKLMTNDVRLHSKNIIIVGLTLGILLALLPFHVTSDANAYYIILYIGGFIISSFAFADYHDSTKAFLSLTLPCSNLERFLSRWFLTSVLYAIGLLVLYYTFSLISYMVNLWVYHQQFQLLDIQQPVLWLEIGKYIILQSVIFLGAITFRKYVLIKTMLAIGCFFFALSMFTGLTTWVFCPNCLQEGISIHLTTQGHDFIFWLIAAPFFWIITFLRLSKIELR